VNAHAPAPRRSLDGRRPLESVAAVIDQVPSDFDIRHPGRGDTLHWSDPAAIRRDVIALDVLDGARILELGTGTGYSSAVLAALAGPRGQVTTFDVSDHLAGWARTLHQQQGVTNVACRVGDGLAGYPAGGGSDRIIAWFTPPSLCRAWVEQLAPGGRIVACLPVAALPSVSVLASVTTHDGRPNVERLTFGGGYAQSHPGPVDDVHSVPPRWVDARTPGPDPSWIAVSWRADDPHGAGAGAALDHVLHPGHTETYGREMVEWRSWSAFAASLGDPALRTVSLHNQNRGIGHTTPSTATFVYPNSTLTADHPDSPSLRILRGWLHRWESAGRPTADAYTSRLEPTGDREPPGWDLRLEL
jgi:protein-L-isoaspartate(D-aspartate) O-methyltransferase